MKRLRHCQTLVTALALAVALAALWASQEYRQRRQHWALAAAVKLLSDERSLVHVRSLDGPTELFLRSNLSVEGAKALCAAPWACLLFLEEPPSPEARAALLTQYRPVSSYPTEATLVAHPRAVALARRNVRLIDEEE